MSTPRFHSAMKDIQVSHEVTDYWEISAASKPAADFLLDLERIRSHLDYCGFSADSTAPILETARRIQQDEDLSKLLWHCYWLVYKGPRDAKLDKWPNFRQSLGENGGIFYLLVSLGMVPLIKEYHRRLGVPDEITRDTAQQVRSYCENHERGHQGIPGTYPSQLFWQRNYVHFPYFRLGRFEYWLRTGGINVDVYRHRESGAIVALMKAGQRINGEGFYDGTGGHRDEGNAWDTRLEQDEEAVTGHPVHPDGYVIKESIRLPLETWQRQLNGSEWVLDVHIPAGGGMTPERVKASKEKAIEFFDRYFPHQYWLAMVCQSWMFNTQLRQILKPTAHLVQYLKELYLYPVKSSGEDGLWFIFLQDKFDAGTAPRDTSLQRDILDFIKAGNTWRGGAMFLMREDLDKFGTQPYQGNWPPMGLFG